MLVRLLVDYTNFNPNYLNTQMKYILIILIPLFFVQDDTYNAIAALNKKMEAAFNAGDLEKVASFYLDDAYLLSPGGQKVSGREAIDQYWMGIKNPVRWELEVIAVERDEADIYENEYWQALPNKPPGWRVNGVDIDEDDELVYQLGRSTLVTMRNGEEKASVVDFLLIWKYTDGEYRILLDTYTWQ